MALLGSIVIALIILCAVVYLLPMLPIPEPFAWVKQALMVLIVAAILIWLVMILTGANPAAWLGR